MKEQIIEAIERLKDVPYKNGDFILTHSWVSRVADDIVKLIDLEVERRIAERMPSENDKRIEADRLFGELTTNFKEGMYSGFFFGCDFLRSRLTQPNNSETESRRTLTDTEIKDIFNNGEPLCKQLHNEQQMWRDIQNKERDDK